MIAWSTPQKPAELTESCLISSILDGNFPVNSPLPPERELALSLGVTRPTLREALQRLSRDGWIEIHQGRPPSYVITGRKATCSSFRLGRHQQQSPC